MSPSSDARSKLTANFETSITMSSTPSAQTVSESSFPFPSNETKASPNPADIVATSVVIFIIVAAVALAFSGIRYRRRRRCINQEEQTKDRETRENARHFSVLGMPPGNTDERGPREFERTSGPTGKGDERTVDVQGLRADDIEKNVFQSSLSSTAPTGNITSPQPMATWNADPFAVADTARLSLPMSDTINASVLPLYSEIVQPPLAPHSRQSTVRAGRPPSYEGFGDGKRRDA